MYMCVCNTLTRFLVGSQSAWHNVLLIFQLCVCVYIYNYGQVIFIHEVLSMIFNIP